MLPNVQIERAAEAKAGLQCPACHSGRLETFFKIEQIPVFCNVLCATREEALSVPRGDMRLGFCQACGHIYNAAFDPRVMDYDAAYENSLQFSPRFQDYLNSLAEKFIRKHDLRDKNIIEIGCGQGDFLSLLCKLGRNRGMGFDPSFDASKLETALAPAMEIVPQYYSHEHANRPVDLLCCRHVLEHIPQPLEFLKEIRRTIGNRPNVLLFFEVPSAIFTLDGLAIWDLIYEHCSYFTPESLRRVFELAGFDVMDVEQVYDGQFLTITARPATSSPRSATPASEQLRQSVRWFEKEYQTKVAYWHQQRDELRSKGRRAVIWGAGSKGATFLNILRFPPEVLQYAVDLNPRKHDHFIVGTAQKIIAPQNLPNVQPDAVIVMNAIYRDEISRSLSDLGIRAQVLTT
jgi:SAM-dependent methyltransferase